MYVVCIGGTEQQTSSFVYKFLGFACCRVKTIMKFFTGVGLRKKDLTSQRCSPSISTFFPI